MKVAIAIAVVAACVAASLSASITHAPDFAAVGAKVEVVRDIIGEAFNKIKDIANNDNAVVGSDISSQLDAAAVKANAVLERINAAIGAGNLTAGQAQDLFTELTDILTGVFKDLQNNLAQLSTEAADQIREQFYRLYVQVNSLFQEIYSLLNA